MKRDIGFLAYLEVGLVTMAAAITGVLYGGFFTSRGYLPAVLGAALGAAPIAALTAVRRWGVLTTTATALGGFALLAVGLVYRDTLDHFVPTVHTATGLGTGLLHGWARMLTVGLPADVTADLLITPVLVTFVATLVSTTLALRTRAILAPTGPTLLALVIGLLFTADRPAAGFPVTAAYLLASLLLVIVRVIRLERAQAAALDLAPVPDPRRHHRVVGRIAFGLPVALVVAALGLVGARYVPVASGTARFDPRTVAPQEFQVEDTLTPLVGLKSQLREQPSRTLFTVQVSGPATIDRVRTAALDRYDGALWTSDDSFLVAGRTLPADPNLDRPQLVHARVSIEDLTGPYLPVVGWPVQVGASGLGFSARSGVLVTHGPDVHGLSYDLVGAVAPDDTGLRSAVPNLAGDGTRDTQLPPGLPVELDAKAKELTGQASTPYAKLLAIRDYLRKLPYSLDARPGHSYDALRRLFDTNSQDRVGYAEQFAAAFAVLARDQGFPTRVAVGYLLRPQARVGDTYTVTTADAHAWAEVDMTGYGWVTFDPTDFTTRPDKGPIEPTAAPGASDRPGDPKNPGSQLTVVPDLSAGPGTGQRILTGTLIGLIALVLLVLLLVVGILLAKFVRRRRHRSGSGAQRIIGAWRDSADRLVERGIAVPRSLTAIEAARHAQDELGESAGAVAVLAPIVTQAVFFPGDPPADAVREAWELNAQFRRDLRRSRGVLRAARAFFDPRPLMYGIRDRRALRRALKELQKG
jgi:transglutaminase-like putative cysteine protease